MVDTLADALNKIKTNERIGRGSCTIASTRLIKSLLSILQREGYIRSFEEQSSQGRRVIKVNLANKINDIGVVKPRYPVRKSELLKYESTYIPSKDFGMLIYSTSEGLLSGREIKERNIGGRLVAYVY
ncbi:MAG: 30S ribosomal protein S8 [Candidatus Micrarchaeaceae archaeon]